MRLKERVAIITGGASGIGEATVREMVKEGAKVIIADIDDEKGQKLAEELNQKEKNTVYCHVDITNEEEIKTMVEKAKDEFGGLDILFSNAGIGDRTISDKLSLEKWQKVIDINLTGVFLSVKHAISVMKMDGGGSIINCASILGHVGRAQMASYTASKGGVVNLTRSLAVEYAKDGIRVNSVCPGYINTPLIDGLEEEALNHLISLHPMRRLGEPEEIAKVTTFLASDDASFITGANLLVDGGYTAI
ncbi:SDR family NAD(P)-dependent oxidoreductase [Natroniella sp. ANB-PHB2]|uniref:SDR family NAD(P)-dependent oxidoreductase n=1 Tax=Natroniella sp. ANB-PHB2 TaxID=3384444 RepID=UPI0038D37705